MPAETATEDDHCMPNAESDQAKITWYLVALYLADVADILDGDKQLKLAHLMEQSGTEASWREAIEEDLELDRRFFKQLLKACQSKFSLRDSMCFVLRGLGCPSPEMRVHDVLGPEMPES
jgi:hypothetical protein